jgi:hypothetical protein
VPPRSRVLGAQLCVFGEGDYGDGQGRGGRDGRGCEEAWCVLHSFFAFFLDM